jgi:FixJ family two-component response regulator
MPGRVHIVDHDVFFRAAIERYLKHAGHEVETYASAEQFVNSLPTESVPGCILLNVRIPGMSGPELQVRLRKLGSTLPIIFLSEHPDVRTTVRVIKAGAEDFLIKPGLSEQLLQAVDLAIAKHRSVYRHKMALNDMRLLLGRLTLREREVFELVIRGATNNRVAGSLGCTARTVKAHRQRVMEKMQVRSLVELVSVAERAGVLRQPTDREPGGCVSTMS